VFLLYINYFLVAVAAEKAANATVAVTAKAVEQRR